MSASSAEAASRYPVLRRRAPPHWWVGALLLCCAVDASAAALSRLATSAGALAALAALVVMKHWPGAHLPALAVPTVGGALVVAGGLAWWRLRAAPAARCVPAGADGAFAARSPVQLPPGTDADALKAQLRRQFVDMQRAWDRGDSAALARLTTREMLDELRLERPASAVSAGANASTEVVTVQAHLLGYELLGRDCVLSVEFSGLLRETSGGGAVPFRELWMLTRSNGQAEGWRLARHQALL